MIKTRTTEKDNEKYINLEDLIKSLKEQSDFMSTGNIDAIRAADAYKRIAKDLENLR